MSRPEKDITGQTFGFWTAIERAGVREYGDPLWKFCCVCGTERVLLKKNVTRGLSKSCGCKQQELSKQVRVVHKLPAGEAAFNQLLLTYKRGAMKRGLSFKLTTKQFKKLTQQNCTYCGDTPTNNHSVAGLNGDYVYNGVDRLDSSKGYTKTNCVTCCRTCNYAKNNLSLKDFLAWIDRLKKHEVTI